MTYPGPTRKWPPPPTHRDDRKCELTQATRVLKQPSNDIVWYRRLCSGINDCRDSVPDHDHLGGPPVGGPQHTQTGTYGDKSGTHLRSPSAPHLMESTSRSCRAPLPRFRPSREKRLPRSEKPTRSPSSKGLVGGVAVVASRIYPQDTPFFDFHPLDHPPPLTLASPPGPIRPLNNPSKYGGYSLAFGRDIPPSRLGRPLPRDHLPAIQQAYPRSRGLPTTAR